MLRCLALAENLLGMFCSNRRKAMDAGRQEFPCPDDKGCLAGQSTQNARPHRRTIYNSIILGSCSL
jgi:hypothetical protein